MPFTPFHFGISASFAFLFNKYIDLPIFVLANVIVDLEPLAVMIFNLNYPLHGCFHTFLFGGMLGLAWGIIAYIGRYKMGQVMRALGLSCETTLRKALLSGILGVFFHVLMDAPLYGDIHPFWPIKHNFLYQKLSLFTVYITATLFFVPAVILYFQNKNRAPA